VEVEGGEGEVAGEAVMELRLPSSGGLNVSEHVNRGTVQRLASCRQHFLVGVRRLTLELRVQNILVLLQEQFVEALQVWTE